MTINQNLTLGERLTAPTPKFFRTLRTIGILAGAVGAAILTAGASLPATVVAISGYLTTAGAVVAAVSSTTVDYTALAKQQQEQ